MSKRLFLLDEESGEKYSNNYGIKMIKTWQKENKDGVWRGNIDIDSLVRKVSKEDRYELIKRLVCISRQNATHPSFECQDAMDIALHLIKKYI